MKEKIPSLMTQVKADQSTLLQELINLENYWKQNKPETADNPSSAINILEKTTEKINVIKDAFLKNCTACKLLQLESVNPDRLGKITREVDDFKNVWNRFRVKFSKR